MLTQFRRIGFVLEAGDLRHLRRLFAALVGNALLEAASVGLILPFIQVINRPEIVLENPWLHRAFDLTGFADPRYFLAVCALGFLALTAFKSLYGLALVSYQEWFFSDKAASAARRLFRAYLQGRWEIHLQRNSAEMINTAESNTTWALTQSLSGYLTLASEGLVALAIAGVLVAAEPAVTLTAAFGLGAVFFAAFLLVKRRIDEVGPQRVKAFSERLKCIKQGLASAKEIKVLGCEEPFIQAYGRQWEKAADLARRVAVLQAAPRLLVETLMVAAIVVIVLVVLWQNRQTAEITAILGLFAVGAFRLMPSLNRIAVAFSNIRYGTSAVNEIYQDIRLGGEEQAVPPPAGPKVPPLAERIQIDHITYTYRDAPRPVLRDLVLTIGRGESLGFVGPSGAGKSTLVDVLLGLLPPESGAIRVDGVDIAGDPRGWQRQIGYVPQSIALIDDTIRRNIAFGIPDTEIDESRLARALALARLGELVASLPQGLDTAVGDAGLRLSGGQRQRIGIARALYREPAVLVMDEATSALDSETERDITQAIEGLRGDRTLIIIAHRLSTVRSCDRVAMLKEGRLLDCAPFPLLVQRCPDFARMVKLAELMAETSGGLN